MLRSTLSLALLLASPVLSAPAAAGIPIEVTWRGTVEYNLLSAPPLGLVADGEAVTMSFRVDTDVFINSPNFPTRGYRVIQSSFSMQFDSATVSLKSPFPPGTVPLFVIRNNDPGVDGFMFTTNVDGPVGVALSQNGVFGALTDSTYVTYGPDTVPSLDILDALGTYAYETLSVFNWTIDDGPANPVGMIFEEITIAIADSAFTDEGCELAGVAGAPRLFGLGDLSGGSNNEVRLDHAAPSALAGLFLALSSTPVPFKGGTLKPGPFFTPTILSTSATGTLNLPFVMPLGVPAGTEIWVQYAIQDGVAVSGAALSNAIRGVTP